MTLTLTLDRVIRHTVVHHSSTSTYIPNFIGIGKNFLWTDGRTSETDIIRSTRLIKEVESDNLRHTGHTRVHRRSANSDRLRTDHHIARRQSCCSHMLLHHHHHHHHLYISNTVQCFLPEGPFSVTPSFSVMCYFFHLCIVLILLIFLHHCIQ